MHTPLIFTASPPWYFSLAFLGGWCPFSFSKANFLCLNPITWDFSVPSKRVVFSTITSFWSHWMYSNFFFSSTILHFLASSFALVSASLLAFWAACSTWWTSAVSCKWRRDCCSSLCCHYISWHCSSSISVLCWEMLERVGEDMIIQKKRRKLPFLFMYCWPRYHHGIFG